MMTPSKLTTETTLLIFALVCTLLVQTVHSSWWYLGMVGAAHDATMHSRATTGPATHYRTRCSEIDVLEPHQRELCFKSKNVLDVVGRGASMGIEECKHQFTERRWNCSTFNTTNVFGKVLNLKSREKAYIYAVSSAGVMHAITKACAKGELQICECDQNIRSSDTGGEFMWGGCSHNIHFGDKFTRRFVDLNENKRLPDGLMNLWNNKAGRKTVMANMKLLCKCHGVSGSCSAKICWRTMSLFRDIGNGLRAKFDGASLVKYNNRRRKLAPVNHNQKRPSKDDLVYLQESPDFCEYDPSLGSLGTRGRQCNKTSYGLDGCTLMCCGRGYHTTVAQVEEDCNCKFFWCCRVECEKCSKMEERNYCN